MLKKLSVFIKENYLLIIIFILALLLRTYNLSNVPVGLHGDEASIGYNAYSILKTGKDQNGHFLPLAIDQFGDQRPSGYHIIDVPFVAIIGLNEFAIRLPAAIFGALNVILIYLLIMTLFQKKNMALFGALLLSILPWDVNISRATSEGIIASFFVSLGVLLFLKGIKSKNKTILFFATSSISFVLSFCFYHAARYFVVVFFPILAFYTFLSERKKTIAAIVVFVILVLGLVFFLSVGKGTGRASEVSLLSIPGGTVNLKHAMDEEGTLNPLINRFYNNKLFYYGRFFVTFYSQHLSGDFLFVNNGLPIRYTIPYTGNLYLIQAPLLLIGVAFLLYEGLKNKKYNYLVPVVWLLIAPIPAGLTWEDLPNIQRAGLMIIPLVIISAVGFYEILNLFKSKSLRILYLVIIFLALLQGFLYFTHNYYWRLRIHEPWYRGWATKDLVLKIQEIKKDNPRAKFYATTQNYNNFIFYLLYTKYDPKKYQEMGSPSEHNDLTFENIRYLNDDCPLRGDPLLIQTKVIENLYYIDKPECPLPKNAVEVSTVNRADGTPAFKILQLETPTEKSTQIPVKR